MKVPCSTCGGNAQNQKKNWTKIYSKIQKKSKMKIYKRPELFLLGIDLRKYEMDKTLLWYMVVAARILYAKYWKGDKIPNTSEWIEKLIFFSEMDKITKKVREQKGVEF